MKCVPSFIASFVFTIYYVLIFNNGLLPFFVSFVGICAKNTCIVAKDLMAHAVTAPLNEFLILWSNIIFISFQATARDQCDLTMTGIGQSTAWPIYKLCVVYPEVNIWRQITIPFAKVCDRCPIWMRAINMNEFPPALYRPDSDEYFDGIFIIRLTIMDQVGF